MVDVCEIKKFSKIIGRDFCSSSFKSLLNGNFEIEYFGLNVNGGQMTSKVYFKSCDYFKVQGSDDKEAMINRTNEAINFMKQIMPNINTYFKNCDTLPVVLLDYSLRLDHNELEELAVAFRYFYNDDDKENPIYKSWLHSANIKSLYCTGKLSAECLWKSINYIGLFPLYILGFSIRGVYLSSAKIYLTNTPYPGLDPIASVSLNLSLEKMHLILDLWEIKIQDKLMILVNLLVKNFYKPVFYGINQDTCSNRTFKIYFCTTKVNQYDCFMFLHNIGLVNRGTLEKIRKIYTMSYFAEKVALSFDTGKIICFQFYFKKVDKACGNAKNFCK